MERSWLSDFKLKVKVFKIEIEDFDSYLFQVWKSVRSAMTLALWHSITNTVISVFYQSKAIVTKSIKKQLRGNIYFINRGMNKSSKIPLKRYNLEIRVINEPFDKLLFEMVSSLLCPAEFTTVSCYAQHSMHLYELNNELVFQNQAFTYKWKSSISRFELMIPLISKLAFTKVLKL